MPDKATVFGIDFTSAPSSRKPITCARASFDGEVLRRYIRVANFTPYNLAKDGLYLTTLERVTRHLATRETKP